MVRAVPCARLLRGDSPPDYIGCVTFHAHSLLISFAPRYFPFYPPSLAPDQTGRVHIHVQGLALRLSLRSPRVCIHQALTHQELHICWPHPLTTPTDYCMCSQWGDVQDPWDDHHHGIKHLKRYEEVSEPNFVPDFQYPDFWEEELQSKGN